MDVVQRVIPSTNVISSEKLAKDTKREKHSRQKKWQVNNKIETIETVTPEVLPCSSDDIKTERRTSSDRRLSAKKRGRWLDSRNNKNRRKSNEISMKV
jgi:hypothetical protein